MIPWLEELGAFPPLESALRDPNGLLAAGGDLSPEHLLAAYRRGIFPWYAPGDPILWWSPDPRMVLLPTQMKIARSLRQRLRRGTYRVTFDQDFDAVVDACSQTPRHGQSGTWITPAMRRAYGRLHELGYAHSVETWEGERLVGGLYGVALGRVFYGESMFSHATDASKVALAHLTRYLAAMEFALIDCQMKTDHLASLGAQEIPRSEFAGRLALLTAGAHPQAWPSHLPATLADRPW